MQVGLLAGSVRTLGGRRDRPVPLGAAPAGMGDVGDFPVEKKRKSEDLFAIKQTVGIVCPTLEQFGFSLGSLLQDRQRVRAPPAWVAPSWATSPRAASHGLAAHARSADGPPELGHAVNWSFPFFLEKSN
jgi:hypothetical protein